MDRQLIYPGQILPDTTLLQMSKDAMLGLSKLSAALLGGNTLINGFAAAPSNPASLQVVVAAGEIYSWQNLDDNVFGSLGGDTTHQVMKQGMMLDSQTLSLSAPTAYGQSVNYLIQVGFQEQDSNSMVLPYFNLANPQQPLSGQGNNNKPQNTVRRCLAVVQAKAGIAASSGSQTTPAPDTGFVGAWVVTVNYGQTQVNASAISACAGAPFLTESLLQKISATTAAGLFAPLGGNVNQTFNVAQASATQHAVPLNQMQAAIAAIPLPAAPQVRHTVQYGAQSAGVPAYIGAGSGLQPTLLASTVPLAMTYAAGYGVNGQIDLPCYLTADQSWPAVPANNLSFLYANRTGGSAVTLGSTLAPPQYGATYNQAGQALLHFEGAAGSSSIVDDFGNVWIAQAGAKLQNSQTKFGGTALGGSGANNALNGTSDYVKCSSFSTLGPGGWTLDGWFYMTSLASSVGIFSAFNNANYGAQLYLYSGKTCLVLSSTGSSWDIADATIGQATITANSWNHFKLTYDQVAGKYYVYVNGMIDQVINSNARICQVSSLVIGYTPVATTIPCYLPGYVDEFAFKPYCDSPAGASFSVPTSVYSVSSAGFASDWFNTQTYQMLQVSAPSSVAGKNPAFTPVNRLYLGECTSNGSNLIGTGAVLHFEGAAGSSLITDSYGNTWVAQGGAKLQSNWSKFGVCSLGGAGVNNTLSSGDFIRTTNITNFSGNGWALRGWFNFSTLSSGAAPFGAVNGAGQGVALNINTSGKTVLYLSASPSTWDLSNGQIGSAVIASNTPTYLEVTYDPVLDKVFVYVNGVVDQSFFMNGKKICSVSELTVGAVNMGGARVYSPGYVDDFEFKQTCDHPGGINYPVPTSPASDPATLCITGVTPYAFNGRYDSGLFPISFNTTYIKFHNIGLSQFSSEVMFSNEATGNGERAATQYFVSSGNGYGIFPATPSNRLAVSISTGGAYVSATSDTSGYARIRVRRAF